MSELKSCPFCGSNNVSFVETEEQPLENSTQGFIYCHGCGFSSDVFHDGVIAKKHWNRRAQPANKPLTLGELRELWSKDKSTPFWIKFNGGECCGYMELDSYAVDAYFGAYYFGSECEKTLVFSDYGKTWLAYRYKKES